MELPQNIGLGVANTALLDGRLLLGVDLVYKLWDEADLYGASTTINGLYSLGLN